jgi:hypothetical protein
MVAIPAKAETPPAYTFVSAAQEITQLYWLAYTAYACGWTDEEGAMSGGYIDCRVCRFPHFGQTLRLPVEASDSHPTWNPGVLSVK